MGTIDITRTYNDTELLEEADLDNIQTGVQTFLNATKLDNDNIQDEGIDASTALLAGSLAAVKFQSDAVTTAKLADSPDGIEAAKINNLAVTTAKINDLAVTTGKLAAESVTYAKLSTCNTAASTATGGTSTVPTAGSVSDSNFVVQGLFTKSLTTTGRPVLIQLIGEDDTSGITVAGSGILTSYFAIFRAEVLVAATYNIWGVGINQHAIPSFVIDQPSAGTHQYTFRCYSTSSSTIRHYHTNLKMRVTEL